MSLSDEEHRLVSRWLDGTASDREVAALDALLRANPGVRRALLLAADQDASVREILKGTDGELAQRPAARRVGSGAGYPARSAPPRAAWIFALLACGGAVVALALRPAPEERISTPEKAPPTPPPPPAPVAPLVVAPPPPPPEKDPEPAPPEVSPVPTLTAPQEEPVVRKEPEKVPETRESAPLVVSVEGPVEVTNGAVVAKGTGRVLLASGARVSLRQGTELSVSREALALAKGEVFCEVPRAGKAFSVSTPLGEARVRGTEFGVSATRTLMVVLVVEGSVDARNAQGERKIAAGEAVEIKQGHAPSAPKKADLASLAWRFELDAKALPKGARVLFREDFSKDAGWRGGRARAPLGLPGFALESLVAKDRGPDFFAEATSAKDAAGFPIGPNTYVRFQYLAEKFGPKDHFKVMFKKADETNFGGFVLGIAQDRWTLATLRVTDAPGISDPAAKLAAGEKLHQIVWLGRTEAETKPEGARFFLAQVVLFEVPSAIAADEIHKDPK